MGHATKSVGDSLVQEDTSLVFEAYRISNGVTVHRLNNLVCSYRGFVELVRRGSKRHLEDAERLERELRQFIYQQKALTVPFVQVC